MREYLLPIACFITAILTIASIAHASPSRPSDAIIERLSAQIKNPNLLSTSAASLKFTKEMIVYGQDQRITESLKSILEIDAFAAQASFRAFYLILISERPDLNTTKNYAGLFRYCLSGSDDLPRIAALGILAHKPELYESLELNSAIEKLLVAKQSLSSAHWMPIALNKIIALTPSHADLLVKGLQIPLVNLDLVTANLDADTIKKALDLGRNKMSLYRMNQIESILKARN